MLGGDMIVLQIGMESVVPPGMARDTENIWHHTKGGEESWKKDA
jgi:hypothetical protein